MKPKRNLRHLCLLILAACSVGQLLAADLFDKSNLAAWCIVPFDAAKRGPEARAEMVAKMGIKKIAYDWREEHVAEFEREILAYQKHGIEFFAFWGAHDEAFRLFERYKLHPQLWIMMRGTGDTQEAQVKSAAEGLLPILAKAKAIGSQVGIYNHGGWGGEPENMVAVCDYLKKNHATDNIGIIYNLHHGHSHLDRLPKAIEAMKPHLLCFNLNGMDIAGDTKDRKILPLGVGTEDVKVLRIVRASGYSGPIGILNHTDEDAEGRLLDNLDGLKWLVPQLDGAKPGEKPKYRTWEKANAKNPEPVVEAPKPAAFTPELPPLNKADNVHWQHFVNRERVFDYYGKQALQFMKQTPMPELLPAFPGLDGGQQGHWGNQNDKDTWKDGRWAAADLGTVFSTIFKGGGLTIPKGVCVRYDDRAACFDPLTCTFPVKWEGGFIQLSDERHGFTSGGALVGKVVGKAVPGKADKTLVYHGFYRHGKEVVFSYSRNGAEYLTTAREDGKDLSNLTKGGPAQWPQWIETRAVLGTQTPFATDTITIPFQNPYGTLFFISGHDFFSDGSAAICTMTGEVWLVRGIDEKLDKVRWKRFATGLHQPLGLKIVKDKIYVLGRDQITCLHDLNSDDEADFYECASHAMVTDTGHSYITGLDCDREGRFYFASANQGICRVTLPDKLEVLGTGFRNPNGIGISPDERFVTASQQEGDWIPASAICQIELGKNQGAHFGANGPKNGQPPEPPLLYLPRGEDNSSGGQCFVTGETWSSLKGNGNLIHLSSGSGSAWLMMRQQVNNQWQAAAMKISGNFDSGVQGGRFNAIDGHFYVSGMQGWGSYTPQDGCFQRVRFTGGSTPVPVGFEARDNGVLLRFNVPLDAGIAGRAAAHFAQCWNYLYSASYGSPEFSVLHSNTVGHDPLEIRSAQLLDGGKTLFIEIPQLLPANQIHLHISVTKDRAHDVFLTAHTLAEPFTAFTGYTKIAKTNHAVHVMPEVAAVRPVPWEKGEAGRELHIQATNGMQFAQKELRARAGERLTLTFDNPDAMPHNWVLVKPDAANRVGVLANQLVAAPDALARHYVPDSPDVLCHTRILDPHTKTTIHFTAPAQPGRYPYLCTFPGHWMVMRGILIVE